MEWYDWLLTGAGTIFLLTSVGSLLFGNADMETDFDLNADGFLLSDILSFKGMLHFALGFSLTLTLWREISLLTCSIAVAVGIVFALVLYYLYNVIYKRLQKSMKYTDTISEAEAEVYFWNEEKKIGEVFVTLEGRPVTVTLQGAEGMNLTKGQKIIVSGTRKTVYPLEFLI
ncbi:MAG: hypothetical protein LBD53_11340 [Tannerella sp.]|jgi:uncharacterized membrane protein|nr:hypothetical protein [Tannerella sp.]